MSSRAWLCLAVVLASSILLPAQRGGGQQQGGSPIGGVSGGGGRGGGGGGSPAPAPRSSPPSAPAPSPRSSPPPSAPRSAPAPTPSASPRPSAPAPSSGGRGGGYAPNGGSVARPSPQPAPSPVTVDRGGAASGGGRTAPSGGRSNPSPTPAPSTGGRGRGGDAAPSPRDGRVAGGGRSPRTETGIATPPIKVGGDGGATAVDRPATGGRNPLPRSGGTSERGAESAAPASPRTRGNYEHRGYNRNGGTGGAKLADDATAGRGATELPRGRAPGGAGRNPVDRDGDVAAAVRPVNGGLPRSRPGGGGLNVGGAAGGGSNLGGAATNSAGGSTWAANLYVNGGGTSLNLGYVNGVGTSSALLHANYGRGYAPWYGCAPYSYDPFWSLPHWPSYSTWYGPAAWTPWYAPCNNYYGYAYPGYSGFSGGYWSHRWSVGFGFNACTSYGSSWYPCYRRYSYLPFYYYSTVAYYPVYSTVYVHDVGTASYADTSDPYVEYADDAAPTEARDAAPTAVPAVAGPAPTRLAPLSPLPSAFGEPLVPEYPSGLTAPEYAARADQELRLGRVFDAAEARRRAWNLDPRDPVHPLRLGYALFAAGRFDLAAAAFRSAFELDPYAHRRIESLETLLGSAEAYRKARLEVERRVYKAPADSDARFVLAVAAFMNGDDFAARTEFNALSGVDRSADVFRDEAARRLLGEGR